MGRIRILSVLLTLAICGSRAAWAQDGAGARPAHGLTGSVAPAMMSGQVGNDRGKGTDVPSVAARRLEGQIQIDGLLSEPAWRTEPDIADFVQVEPNPGEAPTEATSTTLSDHANAA
jgi:hypothetical protein